MKRSDILKQLKNESDKFTPDPLEKIKRAAMAENLLPIEPAKTTLARRKRKAKNNAKTKRIAFGLSAALVAAAAACLAVIVPLSASDNTTGGGAVVKNKTIALPANNAYGIGAVSSVKLLGSHLPVNAIQTFSALNAPANASNDTLNKSPENKLKKQLLEFNDYFFALNSFLGEDIISTVTTVNVDPDYAAFSTKMVISGVDFYGEPVMYTMYYTETEISAQSLEKEKKRLDNFSAKPDDGDEPDAPDNSDESDEPDEPDEPDTPDESNDDIMYRLQGVMVIDKVAYALEGERSIESDDGEADSTLSIRAYANPTDKTSYIEMSQETEIENGETDTRYVYSIYSNDELIEQTSVEFETEAKNAVSDATFVIEFRVGAAQGGTYSIERKTNPNFSDIKVRYNINGEQGSFRVREFTDQNGAVQYEYTLSNNDKLIYQAYNMSRNV